MNVLSELRRRKVYQVAAIYAATAWGLLQVADVIFPRLGLPDWTVTFLFALEVVGFPLALILSWIFDFTTGGMVRTPARTGRAGVPVEGESLAVLPFNNMSDDRTLDHLADGLVEDLVTRLHGALGIPVCSRNSTFVYKGAAVDIVKAAGELGAAFVVEGSVRVQGDTARITAQLINATNNHHLWAEKFDRPLGDVFALQDELVDAIATAIEQHIPQAGTAPEAPDTTESKPAGLSKGWVTATAIVVLGLAAVLTWSLEQRGDERRAREVVLPQIEKLIAADDTIGAFARIGEISATLPSDPLLLKYRDLVSRLATIRSDPAGVEVSYKPYALADAEWVLLGATPLEQIRLPLGHLRLKFEGEDVVPTERLVINPSAILDNFTFIPSSATVVPEPVFHLARGSEDRAGMVYVAHWDGPVPVPGVTTMKNALIPAYYIDTFEVTNAQFQEFVDAGGYSDGRYWAGLEFGDTDWSEAVQAFTDQTGQPGPAGWELGRYPHGSGDLPVTGVSWFEASAYARFRGKQLPTPYHWYRAALDYEEVVDPLAPAIIKLSNFAGQGLAPVGQYQGLGFFGAYDMGGNAREWLAVADGDMRWIVGGGWNQVPYQFSQRDFAFPSDRGPTNGFRCMVNADGGPTPVELLASTGELESEEAIQEQPVSEEIYQIYREQFGYVKQNLEPRLLSSRDWPAWREELVHIKSPYSEAGMNVLLLLPPGDGNPLQAMIFMPGSDAFFNGATMDGYNWANYEPSVSAVLHSGRAVVLPVWEGTFDRGRRPPGGSSREAREEWSRSRVIHWRQDLGTTLDYLQTREDMDSDRVGYLGVSYGATGPLAMLAVESRLKTAVLVAGGLGWSLAHPSVRPVNYAPRITMPVLMVNGRYDTNMPLVSTQQPLFKLLGSGTDAKKHVLFDTGHVGFPVNQQRREIGEWLDTWLGAVR